MLSIHMLTLLIGICLIDFRQVVFRKKDRFTSWGRTKWHAPKSIADTFICM